MTEITIQNPPLLPGKRLAEAAGSLLVLLAVVATAAVGGWFMPGAWYRELQKPDWNPPDWIFGPVWTTLYLFMIVAGVLLWRARRYPGRPVRLALGLYGLQLFLNALWTPLFFGLHWMGIAAIEIVALAITLATCCVVFWKVNRWASMLFWPYLAWVSFAATLNIALFLLNR